MDVWKPALSECFDPFKELKQTICTLAILAKAGKIDAYRDGIWLIFEAFWPVKNKNSETFVFCQQVVQKYSTSVFL